MTFLGPTPAGPTSGYSVGVDHGAGVSYQRVSGFDADGKEFGS